MSKVRTVTNTRTEQQSVEPQTTAKATGLQAAIIEAVKAQRTSDKSSSSVSKTMLDIATVLQDKQTIGRVHVSGPEFSESFDTACKAQEDYIKSKDARGYRVDKLPRYWVNPKSTIKAALNFGLDLKAYRTESALRKAVAAKRRELKNTDTFAQAFADFKKECEAMPEDAVMDALKQAKAYLATLLPQQPVKKEAA